MIARDFENKVAVVTGASAGIGRALAIELGRRGAKVLLAARRKQLLEDAAAVAGPSARAFVTDVTRRQDVEALFQEAVRVFGQVDVWVNNAGHGITRVFEALSDEDVDAMVRDNLKSALYGMQVVLPHFKSRNQGALVNVSSMLSRVPMVGVRSAYGAAKAALNLLTEALRFELAREFPDIRVSLVLPGVVATDFGNNALGGGVDSRALPGAQSAVEVARIVADGIRDGRADIYTRPDGIDPVLKHLRSLAGA